MVAAASWDDVRTTDVVGGGVSGGFELPRLWWRGAVCL
jgi:hypothetical protein